MEPATLDDFMAFNEELAALIEAGVPLDVGLDASGEDVRTALGRIDAMVARRVSRGATLTQAVEEIEPPLTSGYRSLIQLGLRTGDLSAGLENASRAARTVDDSQQVVRSAMVYPLIVCGLAYLGMIGFCLFFVPTLMNMHEQLEIPVGPGLRMLQAVREWLPYWVGIPPAIVLAMAVWHYRARSRPGRLRRRTSSIWRWLPGASRAVYEDECANFAGTLARLDGAGTPIAESLQVAAGACGDAKLRAGAEAIARGMEQGSPVGEETAAAKGLPPFLRWAVLHSEQTVGRPRALEMAADVYRASAKRGAERVRVVAPLVACVVVGGGATLLYGLSLFVPVVELLHSLAS